MKECSICHNSVRQKALYCDYCGNLFENLVKINYNSDFNNLLIGLSKLIKRSEDGWYESNIQIENLLDLFWYYLFKYSDLEKVLNKEELSFESISFFPREICYDLKIVNENEIFRKFVMKFNEKLNNLITSENTSEYTFYFLTNLDKKNTKINEIAKLFHLELLSYDSIYKDIKFSTEYKYLNKLRSLLIIKCVFNGKDLNYLKKIVLKKVYSLFGLLTIMKYSNRRIIIYYSNQVETKYNLVNYKILTSETYFEIEDNENYHKSLENKYLFQYYIFNKKIKIEKELVINDTYINKFKEISKNPNIYDKLTQYLFLYYKASIDETLEGSFIKYWILTEKIIKNMLGKMNSDKLMQYRKKVMKEYYKPYLVNRLDELRVKRNDYVHELKNDINQSDCNLIRLVAETLIIDIFSEFDKVKKFNDYGLLLEFRNQKQKIKDITKFAEQGYL